jgi:beta-amylase
MGVGPFRGLAGVASRWGITLTSPDEIRAPGGDKPGSCDNKRAQGFVDRGDYYGTQYGRNFVDWYNQALVSHGERLLTAAHQAFDEPLATTPLGLKIAGVHWQMTCTKTPRISEITAGLIQSTLDLRPEATARAELFGYRNIMDMIARVQQKTGRTLVLHFTDLEMGNAIMCPIGQVGGDTSLAQALVFWIAESAADRKLIHRGENALPCVGNWDPIVNAFQYGGYSGLSLLRLEDSEFLRRTGVRDPGSCEAWSQPTRDQYEKFIDQCINVPCALVSQP